MLRSFVEALRGPIDKGKRKSILKRDRSGSKEASSKGNRDTVRFTCRAHFRSREGSRGPIARPRVRQVPRDPSSYRRNARDGASGSRGTRQEVRPSIWGIFEKRNSRDHPRKLFKVYTLGRYSESILISRHLRSVLRYVS